MARLRKPSVLHDREREWRTLADFASSESEGARLGLVYGRRRQGKTLLLELLARETGGFVFTGLPQQGRMNLRRLARAHAAHTGGPLPAFEDWEAALRALLALGADHPSLVVLDEFPYLVESEPALPSLLQMALEPLERARSRTRLILCGSALHVMRGLLAGSAPLRGRAELELVVHPFGFREAAEFWGLTGDFDLAFRVDALVGGTPAYRAMCGGPPSSAKDFDDWVVRGPLNPDLAMYREGAVLLQEEPGISELSLYYSVLSAIAQGACRRSEIAGVIGRTDNALAHPLAVLEQTRLVERIDDAFRERRPVYRIAEPALRLHQLLIAPNDAELVGGAGARLWRAEADTVRSKILGPHFEELARQWCLLHASEETLGGRATKVRPAVLACPRHQSRHELDLVATGRLPGRGEEVLAIGEAKSMRSEMDEPELSRLEHLREMLPSRRTKAAPRLILFSRGGFTARLRRKASARRDVELVDLPRLYQGE